MDNNSPPKKEIFEKPEVKGMLQNFDGNINLLSFSALS
jgi:hypothetical protein